MKPYRLVRQFHEFMTETIEVYVDHHPSLVNLEKYKRFIHASRLDATTKAYWQNKRSALKTFAYEC